VTGQTRPKRKVLLVDDSPIVRAVVIHALSAAGYETSTIDDPRGLEAAVASFGPDLVLVDATYPNVTDDDLVGAVRRHSSVLPILIFSDRPEAHVQALVASSGARGYVPKDAATLVERIQAFFSA
jgi:DNA-binding response OmpR family regulator